MNRSVSPPTPTQTQAALQALARRTAFNCPDIRQQARLIAQSLLTRHRLEMEPDTVFWHRFVDQVSSPRAFSGWAHYQKPIQSLTLVELVMERFNAEDSLNLDALDTQTGFYRDGADAAYFDERNEVPLLPSEVLDAFWASDFKQRFEERTQQFWASHGDDYRALAKATLIGQALEAREHGALTDTDLCRILGALTGPVQAPATEAMLRATHTPPASVHVSFLRIGQHEATDILHVISEGWHYLYVPGESDPWQACQNLQAVQWWLLLHNNDAQSRARFASHFPLRSALEGNGRQPLKHTLDLLYSNWGSPHCALLDPPSPPLHADAFSELANRARKRIHADAELRLTNSASLRKQIWLGYLGAFNKVFGPLGSLDWPVTLACIGAGMVQVALNVDLAVHARSTEQRQQAVIDAAVASVDLLFNGLFLWGAWREASPVIAAPVEVAPLLDPVTLPEITPERPYPIDTNALLDQFGSNMLLGNYKPAEEGALRGVYTIEGKFYIELAGFSYQVRRAPALDGWVIIDPTAPYAFQRNVPVRLDQQGHWELLPRPGLSGGGQQLGALARRGQVAPAYAPAPPSPYDIPPAQCPPLANAAADIGSPFLDGDSYDFIGDPAGNLALATFRRLRTRLKADSKAFFRSHGVTAPQPPAPLPANPNPRTMLQVLYDERNGLVLGEVHGHEASKRFLIKHMRVLRKAGVNTLYMEHLLADFHAADLAVALQRRTLTPALERYLTRLDAGHQIGESAGYDYVNVIRAASEHGIRVVPLDCLASYRIGGLEDPLRNLRQQMMNYYAHQVIEADQVNRGGGRWVALVGNTHASAFRGIPGLDRLESVTSVRFEDVPPGSGEGLVPDPGRYIEQSRLTGVTLRSDYLYRSETPRIAQELADSAVVQRLTRPSSFLLSPRQLQWQLNVRLADNRLISTPVLRDGSCVLVNLPEMPQLHRLRYTSINALSDDLKRLGLTAVA